jgi:hypothetical protein
MRPAKKKGRIGTIMITPPKLLANDSPPPLMRTVATPRSGTAPPEAGQAGTGGDGGECR